MEGSLPPVCPTVPGTFVEGQERGFDHILSCSCPLIYIRAKVASAGKGTGLLTEVQGCKSLSAGQGSPAVFII